MRPTISTKMLQAILKPGLFKTPPYAASKTNLAINVCVTTLYGTALWAFYKDYMTTKRATLIKLGADKEERPAFFTDILREMHFAPNRLFHSDLENENIERGNVWRTIHSLTYGDVSMFCLGWGFLIQICNVGLAIQGRQSMIYRSSLAGALAFPPLAYFLWRQRLHKMEAAGVQIH